MKTGNMNPGDVVIWNSSEDLLTVENCLPEIANAQITSILSNLEAEKTDVVQDNKHENNYMVLKEKGSRNQKKKSSKIESNNNFEDILYFVCNLCPFLCTKNSKIIEHLENAHKTKSVTKLPNLKCPACVNVFFHKMSLRSHLIHDHGVGNSDINLITQAVVYYATKRKNEKKLPKDPPPLPNVDENSDDETSQTETTNEIIKQGVIAKLFRPKKEFCEIANCKVSLHNSDNLTFHQNSHKDDGFICLECNGTFTTWKPLASHLWRLHKIDMELYSCDKCSYKSVSLAKLNNIHKLIHGDVRAYTCPVCKKAFKNSKQLGNHKLTHKKDYERLKVSCELCAKNFADRRQLKIHIKVVHEKIKPFLCSFCGYKGSSQSSLKMHIRQHTGEKPFACDTCTYTTSDHNSLRRHKLRHTGQKPYKCSYCSYACIQSSTYKVHLKTKHPGQEKDLMFTCQECQFRSVNKEMYISHMITVHDQKPQN